MGIMYSSGVGIAAKAMKAFVRVAEIYRVAVGEYCEEARA